MAAEALFEAADAIREMTNLEVDKCQPGLPEEETWQVLGGMAVRESLGDKPSASVFPTAGGPLRLEVSWGPFWAGYQLCDNSVGVLFNDSTRLIMYNDGDNLQYIEQNNTESYFTVRSYPSALNKKVSPGGRSPGWGVVRLLPPLGFDGRVGSREKHLLGATGTLQASSSWWHIAPRRDISSSSCYLRLIYEQLRPHKTSMYKVFSKASLMCHRVNFDDFHKFLL